MKHHLDHLVSTLLSDRTRRRAREPELTVSTRNATKRCFKRQRLLVLKADWVALSEIPARPKRVSKCPQRSSSLFYSLFFCNVYCCCDKSLKENCLKIKARVVWTTLNSLKQMFWSNLERSNNGFLVVAFTYYPLCYSNFHIIFRGKHLQGSDVVWHLQSFMLKMRTMST